MTAIDRTARQITLKTDAGPDMTVMLQEGATFKRVAPGERDLTNATDIAFADVAVGDRILVRGQVAAGAKTVAATSVIVMTKADISKKQEADRAEWQRRGVIGLITSVDSAAKQITISARTPEGNKPLVVTLAPQAWLRRYAVDSVKFSDAKPGTIEEMAAGDQFRALGNKGSDGATFTAEQVISGGFRNIAGTVVSADEKENIVRLTDLETKKVVVITIGADATLRKLPLQLAQMMAARMNPSAAGDRGGDRGGAPAGGPSRGPGGPGGGGRGPTDLQQMLERMPVVKLSELNKGDALIVSGAKTADATRLTAIALIAGVEPLLTAAPTSGRQMVLNNWMLDMGGGGVP